MIRFIALFVAAFLITPQSFALSSRGLIWNIRYDESIPEACRDLDVENFPAGQLKYITYGVQGAKRKGFTYEYPIARDQAGFLWKTIKKEIYQNEKTEIRDPQVAIYYQTLLENYQTMDFDFGSEGEVLELLAIVELKKQLGAEYFVTGSVAYQDDVAGELDLVIGRNDGCVVETVGEAKLGVRQIGHARQQLQRFKQFIADHFEEILNPISAINVR